MAETLVETANDVEDKGPVSHGLAEGGEIVRHLLQPATVIGDGEVALDEVPKARLQVDGASLPVAEELRLDGKPSMACGGALGRDDLRQVVGEGGDDPGLDDAVHPIPGRRDRDWRFRVDMIPKGELAKDEQELITPAVEVAGVDVKDRGDVIADVVHGDGLGVELQQSHGLMMEEGGAQIGRRWSRAARGRARRFWWRHGGSSGRVCLGRASQGGAGALSGLVAGLRGGGFLLGLLSAGKGCVPGGHAFALDALGIGGGSVGALLYGALGDGVVLDGGRGGVGDPGRGGRGRRHGAGEGAERQREAGAGESGCARQSVGGAEAAEERSPDLGVRYHKSKYVSGLID